MDKQNFKLFFLKYFDPVYQFSRKYTDDAAIAHDIAQDAFIKVYEKRMDFDAIEKAKSFVYTTDRGVWLRDLGDEADEVKNCICIKRYHLKCYRFILV